MLKPKQLFIIIYVDVCVKRVHPHKTNNNILCTAGVGNVLRTSVRTNPTVLEAEVLWSGMEFVIMVALSSKLIKEH